MQFGYRVPRPFWLVGITMLFLLVLNGCTYDPPAQQSSSATPTLPPATVNILLSTDGPRADDYRQWCGAHPALIADSTVGTIDSSYWDTPGHVGPPSLDTTTILNGGYFIVTPFRLSKMQPLLDHRQQPTQEYMFKGGQVGTVKMMKEDSPHPKVGYRYVMLFAQSYDPQTRAYTQSRLELVAAFPIDTQGMVLLDPQTTEQGVIRQPEVKIPLSQIQQQLAPCK